MKTVPALLFLILQATAACTVAGEDGDDIIDEGEVTLANPDDQGKSDTVFGKALRYNIRGEWPWQAGKTSMTTDSEVLVQTTTAMRVKALRVAIGLPPNDVLDLSVDAEAFNDFGEISTDMAFIMWTAGYGDRAVWLPTTCAQNYFERVVIDPERRAMDAMTREADGDSARTYTFAECGIPDDISQVALFAFPSSGWWSLEGYYHLKIEADCSGSPCPPPRPIFTF